MSSLVAFCFKKRETERENLKKKQPENSEPITKRTTCMQTEFVYYVGSYFCKTLLLLILGPLPQPNIIICLLVLKDQSILLGS